MPRRAADSQSDSEVVSDPSQPFEPREDDDQTLYEVIEITGETKDNYRVRWQGNDPKTKKPWPQSWVPKRDCTDDLVLIWKTEKKKQKERRNSKKSGRGSTSSKRMSHSVASTARTKSRSESIATSSTKRRKGHPATAGPSNLNPKPKSKRPFGGDTVKEEDESESTDEGDLGPRQHASVSVRRSNVISPSHNSSPSDDRPEGTKRKRKLEETQSVNSSYQATSRRMEASPVDVDIDEEQIRREVIISKPPKKKRRIASDSEKGPSARKVVTHKQKKKNLDVRNGTGGLQTPVSSNDEEEGDAVHGAVVKEDLPRFDEEEEEEEGLIEDALPDGYHSASMDDPNNKFRHNDFEVDSPNGNMNGVKQQTKFRQKEKNYVRDEEEEESDEVEFLESPRPPTRSNAAPIVPRPKGPPRMMPQPPPSHWKTPPSNNHRRQPVATEVPTLGSKAVNKTRPATTMKISNDPSFVQSSSNRNPKSRPFLEQDSDSDKSPPEWHRKTQLPKPANKHPRIEALDVMSIQGSDESDIDVSLSPRAWKRLALFDAEVIGKETRVVEKKQAKEMNGKGESSTLNRSSSSGSDRPTTTMVRPTQRFDTQSYNMDVVPETELENSQEDKLQAPSIASKSHESRNNVSLLAPSIPGPSVTKPLRPLPHISPSTFHAHLPPTNSSLPDTIVEPSSSLERRPEIDAIEQFESPEKEHGQLTKTIVLKKNGLLMEPGRELEPTANQRESAEYIWGSEAVRRQGIAEKDRVSASGGPGSSSATMKKKSVQEVVARAESRRRSEGNASQPDESDNDDEDDEKQPEEESVANASTAVVPPASGPPALSEEQPPPMGDMPMSMQDDPIDLNGDVYVGETEDVDKTHDDIDETSAGINPELLRQEEEENTQDIMAQRQYQEEEEGMMQINPDEGGDVGPPPVCAPSLRVTPIPRDTGESITLVPAQEPKHVSHASFSRSLQKGNQHHDERRGPITRSRSRSKTPSLTITGRNNARGKKPLTIPSPVPSGRESAEPEPEPPKSVENVQGSSAPSSVFAAQISSLQTQVNEKQVEIDSLQQVLDTLREQLRSSEDQKTLSEAERQRQITGLQSQWANEKSGWEGERTVLVAHTAASERSRIQAEEDREFFREQYANASAFVTTVREENKDLEQRVKIAEDQSKKGVDLIRATFQLQVAKLQDEAKVWRRMAEFAIQKDVQTNDDIRKRAAEEPELRVLCGRQKKNLKEAQAKINVLGVDLQEKASQFDATTEELEHCKKENARLHDDLNEALIKLDRIGRSGEESTQDNDHEFVYRCMWRVEMGDTQSVCPDVFLTMRELEQHIYSGHLTPH